MAQYIDITNKQQIGLEIKRLYSKVNSKFNKKTKRNFKLENRNHLELIPMKNQKNNLIILNT